MNRPYNTGKVSIGSNYDANPLKPKYVEYDTDMLLLQHALVGNTKQYRRDKLVWRIYIGIIATVLFFLLLGPSLARAGAIATMPNKAGGKIVLTDETCKHNGKAYDQLNRAYNYGTQGYTTEGCYFVEDETVVVIWDDGSATPRMRYPAENFTLIKRNKTKGGTQI